LQYTLAAAVLIGACLITRRLRGAVLTAVSLPAAIVVTEFVLKPLVGRTLGGFLVYPSGHTSRAFAFATVIAVLLLGSQRPTWPSPVRAALALAALLAAAGVAVAVTAISYHYFSDTIGGAAVGVGTVLATALALDWIAATLLACQGLQRRADVSSRDVQQPRPGPPGTS
jgi:membrane-associated phospholipid phosphatase